MKIAVIPARGGSKRIPRKNIREFGGKPIIAYSIECALRSDLFDRVIVSTDDEEIAEVARRFGAEVPFVRPGELSDDHSNTTDVIVHSIEYFQSMGEEISAVCCIYATAPFLRKEYLSKGLVLLESAKWKYVFSAVRFEYPVFRSFQKQVGGGVKMLFPEFFDFRSQDLPDVMHDAGQFYWGLTRAWLDRARMFSSHSTVVTIPHWCAQDIDTEEDWVRAEIMDSYLRDNDRSVLT